MEFIENEKVLINNNPNKETAIEGYFCKNFEDGYMVKQFIDSETECYFPFIWKLEYTPFKNTLESRKFLLGKKIMNKNDNSQMFIISSFGFILKDNNCWIYLTNSSHCYTSTHLLEIFLFLDGTPVGERK